MGDLKINSPNCIPIFHNHFLSFIYPLYLQPRIIMAWSGSALAVVHLTFVPGGTSFFSISFLLLLPHFVNSWSTAL